MFYEFDNIMKLLDSLTTGLLREQGVLLHDNKTYST